MSKEFKIEGEFWLPDREDRRIAGILTFNGQTGGKLTLIGSVETESEIFRNIPKEHSRIIGSDGASLYTLDDCFRTNSTIIGPQLARRQTFHVGSIIKGIAAFERNEEVDVDGLSTSLTNLLDWVRFNGIEELDNFTDQNSTSADWEIFGKRHTSLISMFSRGTITVGHQLWRSDHGLGGLTIHQDAYVKLEFDNSVPLAEAIDYASDIQDLVSIATTRVAAFESVHFYHPIFTRERPDGTKMPHPAEFITDWIAKPQSAKNRLSVQDMLFTFDQLGGAEGIERWMPIALKYRSILGRVMNTIYAPFMFVQDKLLHRVAALESFHRLQSGLGDGVTLNNRLKMLAALAGEPFRKLLDDDGHNGNISKWCSMAKDERNEIAHHLGRLPYQASATIYALSQGAYWLLIMCLLREAEAPDTAFEHMMNSAIFHFESNEIQSILQ